MAKSEKLKQRRQKVEGLTHGLNGMKLLGEVVCFNARSEKGHKQKDVVDALTAAGLDSKFAREIMPRFAFSRACKKLSESAVIDVVKETQDKIQFQFTKKMLKNDEFVFSKETMVFLNTTTGEIECAKKELKAVAQRLVDEAMENRTTTDITAMIQRMFDKNGDLFPLRDQGGVYFVPVNHAPFLVQIEKFLEKLGGSVYRFPVPAGTQYGERAVQESIAGAFEEMIQAHETAIDQFTINTRGSTMEAAAGKIKATRVKIEAYADYLKDKSGELLKLIDKANKKLSKQIDELAKEKENAPPATTELFGHSVTAILKWMGKNSWEYDEAKAVLIHHGFRLAESTIRGQLWCGRSGQFGKPAELEDDEVKQLDKDRKRLMKGVAV